MPHLYSSNLVCLLGLIRIKFATSSLEAFKNLIKGIVGILIRNSFLLNSFVNFLDASELECFVIK